MALTAKEFLKDAPCSGQYWEDLLIKFATLHVKAALEAAADDYNEGSPEAVREAIIDAYPLTNIK